MTTTFYLLTACTDHEGEAPLFLAADVDAAKAAARTDLAECGTPGKYAPDAYAIYAVQPGAPTVRLFDCDVRGSWDPMGRKYTPVLSQWLAA